MSVHRGLPAPGGVPARGGGVPAPGGSGRGWDGVPGGDPLRTATAAGGTHPTGMHSCLFLNFHLRCKSILLKKPIGFILSKRFWNDYLAIGVSCAVTPR